MLLPHAATDAQAAGEVEALGGQGEGGLVDDARAHERPRSLIELGVGGEDQVGDREVDNGVAEELEAFVGLAVVLGRVARMRDGHDEQLTRASKSQTLG
jgi:hypothetical protein